MTLVLSSQDRGVTSGVEAEWHGKVIEPPDLDESFPEMVGRWAEVSHKHEIRGGFHLKAERLR